MSKISKILMAFLIILGGGFSYFIYNFGPIVSGFGAKGVCSCMSMGNRTLESVVNNELGAFPLSLGTFEYDATKKVATGSVFGFAKSEAFYRDGLGCTLVREYSKDEITENLPSLSISSPELSDTVYWPIGTKISDTTPVNIDLELLEQAVASSFQNTHPELPAKTRSVVVIYKGQLITEAYAPDFNSESVQLGWSMAKSVTNTLFGIMVNQGKIKIDLPAPVEGWEADERAQITIDDLLRMNSGLYWEEVYSNVSTATNMLYKYADMGSFAASQKSAVKPNTEWYYSSGTTNILSQIMRNELGEDYYLYPYNELFNKLGMTSAVIETDASGTYVGSSYMWANARDWGKIGQLYLQDGVWNGERLLPEGWVDYTVQPSIGTPKGEYGAQWWLNKGEKGNEENRLLPDVPTDMYMMDGYEGQRVFVVPSKDLVVVRLGQNKRGGFDYNKFLSEVISSVN